MNKFKHVKDITTPRVAAVMPYKDGQLAYTVGIKFYKNPYRFGSTEHELWGEGWRDAEFRDPSL